MPALRDALWGLPDAVFADAFESDGAYLLVVDLPGTTRETVDVRVEGRRLRVEARREKAVPNGFQYRTEERSLFLDFDLPLPTDAVPSVDEVRVDRGVLEVTVPKDGGGERVSIAVSDGDRGGTAARDDQSDGDADTDTDGERPD